MVLMKFMKTQFADNIFSLPPVMRDIPVMLIEKTMRNYMPFQLTAVLKAYRAERHVPIIYLA